MATIPQTAEEIKSVIESSSYDPSTIPILEEYVHAVAEGTAEYSLEANRALVKLYSFFPDECNSNIYSLVLLLALLEFPGTDLLNLSCMIPDKFQSVEPAVTVISCSDLLGSCKFPEFWKAFEALENCTDHPSLSNLASSSTTLDRIRQSMVSILALSFRRAPLDVVMSALKVDSPADLETLKQVESVDSKSVAFVATPDNTKRNRVFQEGVSFGAIASMMGKFTISGQ